MKTVLSLAVVLASVASPALAQKVDLETALAASFRAQAHQVTQALTVEDRLQQKRAFQKLDWLQPEQQPLSLAKIQKANAKRVG
ncbi:hypothetical protein CWI80_07460 [Pseudidiomarina sediminum]|uniref:TolC family protein n=1 Tax=Pseudidiomarina sediminum TaxID=431675 RepID=A0A432Z3D9_9GAMM|nr:hypothetical protein [Pseudidiomarina sediminum]MBY6064701.1 hypothetical protein [Pseudidiomarina sediminum]RUO72391.1 hypothetical protein CWI80_07460 [Pseudidiomarina sediminum]